MAHFLYRVIVSDFTALSDELIGTGVKPAGPPDGFTNADGAISSIFVYDPDGVLVQFDGGAGG